VTITAVSTYDISVFLHVTAVVVGFGATFAESIAFPVAIKLDARHLPYVHRFQLAINQWFATPALVVVLVTGMYQVSEGGYSFGDAWISATLAIVIVLGGLIGGYFVPADRRLGAMVADELAAAGDGPVTLSDEYQRRARIEGNVGALAGVLIIDGSDPVRSGSPGAQEEYRRARTTRLAGGTLACPRCDAPVALAPGPAAPSDRLACPFCGHAAALRDFLSLADPSRPARVDVRVVAR
jgi:uncharacterized membrane protein